MRAVVVVLVLAALGLVVGGCTWSIISPSFEFGGGPVIKANVGALYYNATPAGTPLPTPSPTPVS